MRKTIDRRVVPEFVLAFVRACQARVPCHLGGGAALAGAYLGHRTTGDIDLFVHDGADMRALVGLLPSAAAAHRGDRHPGVLSWLLAQFPTHPFPAMLEPLTSDELKEFRDALAERFRRSVAEP